jgi:hypothetical protein
MFMWQYGGRGPPDGGRGDRRWPVPAVAHRRLERDFLQEERQLARVGLARRRLVGRLVLQFQRQHGRVGQRQLGQLAQREPTQVAAVDEHAGAAVAGEVVADDEQRAVFAAGRQRHGQHRALAIGPAAVPDVAAGLGLAPAGAQHDPVVAEELRQAVAQRRRAGRAALRRPVEVAPHAGAVVEAVGRRQRAAGAAQSPVGVEVGAAVHGLVDLAAFLVDRHAALGQFVFAVPAAFGEQLRLGVVPAGRVAQHGARQRAEFQRAVTQVVAHGQRLYHQQHGQRRCRPARQALQLP